MKTLAIALATTTALAAPAQAADIYHLLGPVLTDPTVAQIGERCDFYLREIDLRRDALIGDSEAPTFANTLERFDDLTALAAAATGEMSLYEEVLLTPELREAAGACTVRVNTQTSEVSLSRPVFDRLSALDLTGADPVAQNYLTEILAGFRRSGVALDDAGRARVQAINTELSEISILLARNIAEDVRTIQVMPEELAGVPQDFIDSRPRNVDGSITLTTATTDYFPVMTYADSDDLRRRFADIYGQRAHPMNDAPLRRMFTLRQELAQLTGFANYAEMSLADRMLNTPAKVTDLIATTAEAARPVAAHDLAQTLAVLQTIDPAATAVQPWQANWLAPRVQRAYYAYDPLEARQYFAYDNVRDGILALTERLFGIDIRPWDTPVWHESVEAFEMVEDGAVIGRFYLDSHPRPGKYTHANVVPVRSGDPDGGVPIAALVQNLPRGDHSTGLMEHSQVVTFLHEFGHVLHAMFGGSQELVGTAAFGVEWDFVEAPSQMLENWVYDYDTLATFAVNAEGQTIPRELVERMNQARYFGLGMTEMSQLGLTNVSLNFHTQPLPEDLGAATRAWRNEYSPIPVMDNSQMQASFGHLDGYGAAYYTYGWSRVIANDLFSRFRAEGLSNTETADDYRRLVLAPGGTKPAAQLVRDFLGRDVSLDAFRAELARGLPSAE